ncbi:unnamed protein product [Pocillopora meandrina]|uniref:Secreted protein n=1 Tax=Pocillopora meandrina TaxID=46732 RepID=A0AAU9XGZ6_9CNID|nr:unnamed protein product [Pocillopora meandrina]
MRNKIIFLQFSPMILCEVGRSPAMGPVDEIDECYYIYDQCYIAIEKSNICDPFPVLYILYNRDGCSGCRGYSKWYCLHRKNSRWMKEVCECDSVSGTML